MVNNKENENGIDAVEEDAEVLEKLIDEADPQEKKVIMRKLSITKSGPLPDAEDLEKYEKVLPGSADRIVSMAEKQLNYRIELANKEQEKFYKSENTITIMGVICSMIVSISGITAAVFLGMFGQSWASGLIGTLSLGNIVSSMLKATSKKSD